MRILRLRNGYQYQEEENFNPDLAKIVENMYKYLDCKPKIIMSSWSPPINLKSNNSLKGGTLKKNENGEFMYDEFAQYWVDSLKAYKRIGIEPDYISIQNEPTWGQWDSCLFKETETTGTAGYDKALEAVHGKLQSLESRPGFLASEDLGIGYSSFSNFAEKFNRDLVYGYAYHLYHGGDEGENINPDSFNKNFGRIVARYPDKPIFQTEYDQGDWFYTAWIIHNALVHGNVSAYLYWALVWGPEGKALVNMEDINNPSNWTTPEGYIISRDYYAFRQYSKFISPGWKRISTETKSEGLRVSAFMSPDKDSLTVVVLNVSDKDIYIMIKSPGLQISGGDITRTSEREEGQYIGKYKAEALLDLPARSITTLLFNTEFE